MAAGEKLKLLYSEEEIKKEVTRLAQEIDRDYRGKRPLLLGILKGSFVFMADLIRLLEIPAEIDFVRLSSYGSARASSGEIKVVQGLRSQVKGRDVLVIEDIVDTGLTVSYFLEYLRRKKPSSLKLCALFDKPHEGTFPFPSTTEASPSPTGLWLATASTVTRGFATCLIFASSRIAVNTVTR